MTGDSSARVIRTQGVETHKLRTTALTHQRLNFLFLYLPLGAPQDKQCLLAVKHTKYHAPASDSLIPATSLLRQHQPTEPYFTDK